MIYRGVRHGDTLSLKVFTVAMDAIFNTLDKRRINFDGEKLI